MMTAVVRTWLVYLFTLLAVAALNIDSVGSWYLNQGEGRENIRLGLAKLAAVHSETGVGPWLTSLECTAGSLFDGAYKDKSKCRAGTTGTTSLASWKSREKAPVVLTGSAQSPSEDSIDHLPPFADRDLAIVMHEPDGATRDHLIMEALVMGTSTQAHEHASARIVPVTGSEYGEQVSRAGMEASERSLGELQANRADSPSVETISGKSMCDEAFGRTDFQSVLLVGDSLAHGLALSLGRDLKDRRGAVFSFVAKVASGLNNPNVFNWERTVRMLIEHGAPDLLLVMMGVNDANNHIREGGKLCAVGTPEWGQAYESKVENFLRIASENNVHVCWIGVPVVREEGLQNRVLLANMAARNACNRVENCRFIDTFEALCDENKKYTNYLKEPNGSSIRIRAKDGIHFSMEGSNLLSNYILQKLENGGAASSAQN
ncbi:MAG: DUF459 domain-containing protein [Syntrophobacteraceae bacterium]